MTSAQNSGALPMSHHIIYIFVKKKKLIPVPYLYQAGVRRAMAQGGLMYGAGFGLSAFGVMNHRNQERATGQLINSHKKSIKIVF